MDGRRFDSLTAAFARRSTRRSALRGTGIGLSALLGSVAGFRGATAQEATPDGAGSTPTLLFVQTATGGSFAPNPQAGTPAVEGTPTPAAGPTTCSRWRATTAEPSTSPTAPTASSATGPTQQFLDRLGFTPDNPPNAALVTEADADAEDEVIILELITPTYDEAAGTLTYGATVLGAYAGEPLTQIAADQDAGLVPETFGRASLFIDDLQLYSCEITTCVLPGGSVAFPIPGGPYAGQGSTVIQCSPVPMDEARLTAICNESPHCPGHCTPG